jgi:AcrR family transcriptional regulator
VPPKPLTKPRKRAQQARSRATVDEILAAAAEVLVTVGYDRASTKRIAAAAGLSIGSLYQYFPSKEAVVAALLDRHIAGQFAVLEAEAQAMVATPLPKAAQRLVTAFFSAQQVDRRLRRVFIEEVPRAIQRKRLAEIEARAVQLVRGFVDGDGGDFRALVIVRAVQHLTYAALVDDAGYDETVWQKELTRLVLRYLQNRSLLQ